MRSRLSMLRMLLAAMCLFPLQNVYADSSWYADLDYDVVDIDVSGQDYYPNMLSLSAGRWLFQGIGLEIQLGRGVVDDIQNGVDISITGLQSLYVRWQSPAVSGLSAYLLTGYSRLQLDGSVDTYTSYPGSEWFSGPAIGIGLHGKLASSEHWGATLGYKHYFLEDEITTDSFNMGLRYDF